MRVLVTGAEGFVGRHVARDLARHGHATIGFDIGGAEPPPEAEAHFRGDLQDEAAFSKVVADTRPDAALHLAGLTFVPEGWARPGPMFAVNVIGTIHFLQAFREHAPRARLLVVSTAQVYGSRPRDLPVSEDEPLQPKSLYAISKAAAEQITLAWTRHYGVPAIVARPFNHIGPGQSPNFAVASFARQIKAISRGQGEAVIRVGNLQSQRDFTDVRDVARAYRLLLESGAPGQAYNIASGRPMTMGSVLEALCSAAGVHPQIVVDENRLREADRSPTLDIRRIERDVGWKPEIGISETLRDILNAS